MLSVQFSQSVMSDSLQPHESQHARLLCPPLSPGVCSNSCPVSWCCYLAISSPATRFSLLPTIFLRIRVFSNELALCIRWSNYWNSSFSISPFNEYLGLISFRIDWFNSVQSNGLSRVFSRTTI